MPSNTSFRAPSARAPFPLMLSSVSSFALAGAVSSPNSGLDRADVSPSDRCFRKMASATSDEESSLETNVSSAAITSPIDW